VVVFCLGIEGAKQRARHPTQRETGQGTDNSATGIRRGCPAQEEIEDMLVHDDFLSQPTGNVPIRLSSDRSLRVAPSVPQCGGAISVMGGITVLLPRRHHEAPMPFAVPGGRRLVSAGTCALAVPIRCQGERAITMKIT
jgi:hypothetical protein